MKYRDYFTEYDEDEVVRFEKYLTRLSSEQIDSLYDYLIEVSIDANPKINDSILDGRVKVTGSNEVEYFGCGEYSSQKSLVYLDIYVDNILIGELVFDIGQAFASEGQVLSLEFIEEETALAKLSERVTPNIEVTVGGTPSHHQQMMRSYAEYMRNQQSSDFLTEQTNDLNIYTQENTMTQLNTTNTLRTLNLTLLDLSPELKGENKVVYEQANVRTEYTDEQTIQNLLATGDVLSALQLHNEKVRAKTLDAQYKGAAREVFLEEIDHLGDSRLKWEVIRVG